MCWSWRHGPSEWVGEGVDDLGSELLVGMDLRVSSGDVIEIGFVGGMGVSGRNMWEKGLGHPSDRIGLYW